MGDEKEMHNKLRHILKKLSLVLIIMGILVSLYPLYTFFYAHYEQTKLAMGTPLTVSPVVGSPNLSANSSENTSAIESEKPAKLEKTIIVPKHGEAMMRLEIPDLKLSVMVLSGTEQSILAKGAGWYEQSALPGKGNTAIAAHNNMYGSWFRDLHKLQNGSEIKLMVGDTKYIYTVEKVFPIAPNDWSVIAPTDSSVLTLTTCYTKTQRLACRARLKEV